MSLRNYSLLKGFYHSRIGSEIEPNCGIHLGNFFYFNKFYVNYFLKKVNVCLLNLRNFQLSESGPDHMRNYLAQCKIGEIVTQGEGNSKKVSLNYFNFTFSLHLNFIKSVFLVGQEECCRSNAH